MRSTTPARSTSTSITGGFDAWKAAGYTVATGTPATKIAYAPKPRPGEISVAEFTKLAANTPADVLILDVRNQDEANAGMIKGAKLIPDEELVARMGEVPKDKRIIAHCSTGVRAEMAYHKLKDKGYNVGFVKADIDDRQGREGHGREELNPRRETRRRRPRAATAAQEKAGHAAGFFVSRSGGCQFDSTHLTMPSSSAPAGFTFGWPVPSASFFVRLACASALPLYFAATSLNDGPIFLVSTAWQVMQPPLVASSAVAAFAAPAIVMAASAAAAISIDFIFKLLDPVGPGGPGGLTHRRRLAPDRCDCNAAAPHWLT